MTGLSAFHDVRFPIAVSFGATGGPEHVNEIVRMVSGRERRNARYAQSRRRYDAGTGLRSLADLYEVLAFFEARRGSLHGFRFRDPFDWQSCPPGGVPSPLDQVLGVAGSQNRFELAKAFGIGPDQYRRPIAKPVAGSVRVAVDGIERQGFSVDGTTGAIAFDANALPREGALVSAGFSFDVPVRFDTERIEVSLTGFKAGQIPSIPLIEIQP